MNEAQIYRLLEERLAALSPAIPIIWQGKTPPKDFNEKLPYCKAFVMPARPRTLGLREKTTIHIGFLQVSLCYPTGKGKAAIDAQAVAVQEFFPAGLKLRSSGESAAVQVRGKPYIAPPTNDAPLVVPVTISYQCIF